MLHSAPVLMLCHGVKGTETAPKEPGSCYFTHFAVSVWLQGTPVLESMITDTRDIACHPTQPELAVLGHSGVLQRWDMVRHVSLASRKFTKAGGAKVVYARDGSFVVRGGQGWASQTGRRFSPCGTLSLA